MCDRDQMNIWIVWCSASLSNKRRPWALQHQKQRRKKQRKERDEVGNWVSDFLTHWQLQNICFSLLKTSPHPNNIPIRTITTNARLFRCHSFSFQMPIFASISSVRYTRIMLSPEHSPRVPEGLMKCKTTHQH